MDYIKMLREDSDLSDLLCDVCDIEGLGISRFSRLCLA